MVHAESSLGLPLFENARSDHPQVPEPLHWPGSGHFIAHRPGKLHEGRPKNRGAKLGLTQEKEAFYDALDAADSTAIGVLGEPSLREIAKQLVETARKNVSFDWTVKETMRAKLRLYVKRVLKERGYPPIGQETVMQTVLQQAELLCGGWR